MHPSAACGGELIVLYIGCELKKLLALLGCEYTQGYRLITSAFDRVDSERIGVMVLVPVPVWFELSNIPNLDATAKSGIDPVNEDVSGFIQVRIFL